MRTCVAVEGGGGDANVCGSGRRCGGGSHVCGSGKAVVVVPTFVAVAVTGGGGGAHVCGGGRRRRWCPRVWQWKSVVLVPTCVAMAGGVVLVPTCVAVTGGVVVVPACVAVEGGGCGAHVCGSGRRWW